MAWPAPDIGMPPSPPAPRATGVATSPPLLSGKPASPPTFSSIRPSTTLRSPESCSTECRCRSLACPRAQSMTLEAHAFSQGIDVTSSVGPFTFTSSNTGVATLVPLPNNAYNFATNQATATASTPGITQIFATASGVSSKTFQQPQYSNPQGNSPVLDFLCDLPRSEHRTRIGSGGVWTDQLRDRKGNRGESRRHRYRHHGQQHLA